MTPTRSWRLSVPAALAAATIAAGAAQACRPAMSGGDGPPQGATSQGGSSQGGASQGGGYQGGGSDNAGAERLRQGADDATRGGGGEDGPRRASSGGGETQSYSNQISALGAAEANDQPAAAPRHNSYDGTHAGGDSLESIKNDWAVSEAMMNGGYITDAWKDWNDLPWWQKSSEDEPLKYRAGAPKISETDGVRREKDPGGTGGPSVLGALMGEELEHSLKPLTPAPPAYEDPEINPDYKAWLDLPWYSKLTTTEPPHKRPTGAPSHSATPHAGARG